MFVADGVWLTVDMLSWLILETDEGGGAFSLSMICDLSNFGCCLGVGLCNPYRGLLVFKALEIIVFPFSILKDLTKICEK